MITRLIDRTGRTTAFAVHALPEPVQETVLGGLVHPLVISSSMAPTLLPGDRLDLEPADQVETGDLVVFRRGTLLVCHRVEGRAGDAWFMKGDAVTGSPERVARRDIIARVRAADRAGVRVPVSRRPPAQEQSSGGHRPVSNVIPPAERLRAAIGRLMASATAMPLIRRPSRWLVFHLAQVDVLERAPLSSFRAEVWRGSVRLPDRERLRHAVAARPDLSQVTLILRIGPLYLGTCTLVPWSLRLRHAASALDLETSLQSIRPTLAAFPPDTRN